MNVNINVFAKPKPEENTEQIICAHCKLPHPCTKEYKDKYAAKGKAWWCGLCYCAFLSITMKTECGEHEVPPFDNKPKT